MTVMTASYMREYRQRRASRRAEAKGGLLPFQQSFVDAVCRVNHPPDVAALSCPRGSGKSWLAGRLIARSITLGDALFEPGVENILVAASRSQAGITLEFAREALAGAAGYRWSKDGVIHVESRARVRVISLDSRRALGLGAHVRLIVCEEPAAWFPTS